VEKEAEARKIKSFIAQIKTSQGKEFSSLIQQLRKDAVPELLPHLIERWSVETTDQHIQEQIFQFLIDLRDPSCSGYIVNAAADPDFENIQKELLSVMWQSKLDGSDYIDELVDIALKANIETIIEVATIIGEIDNTYSEDQILDWTYLIQEHIDETSDEDRGKMLMHLIETIKTLPLD
jgi:hypothetical protein